MDKISIIIPCYNVEKYLPKCLDSIVNQTYKNLEIICINDGSTDNSLKILDGYKEKDDRIIVINQKNRGLSETRNAGIKKASGKYIMFVDSDDWIDLDTCERAILKAIKYKCDLVLWSYVREFGRINKPKMILGNENTVFNSNECKELHRRLFGLRGEELLNPENADSLVTAWGKLYKADLIKNVEFVSTKEIGTEDALFNCYAMDGISTAYYIAEPFYHYRKDNNSLTSAYNEKLFVKWNNLFDIMKCYIHKNNLDKEYSEALNNRICLSIIGLGLNIVNADKKINKVKKIKKIISSPRYRQAYKQLTLRYFPLHWKVFFVFAKYNCSIGVYLMLLAIKKLIGR